MCGDNRIILCNPCEKASNSPNMGLLHMNTAAPMIPPHFPYYPQSTAGRHFIFKILFWTWCICDCSLSDLEKALYSYFIHMNMMIPHPSISLIHVIIVRWRTTGHEAIELCMGPIQRIPLKNINYDIEEFFVMERKSIRHMIPKCQ